MSQLFCFTRANRIERQAYKWVMKMLDDPGRHAPALGRWLDKDLEHRAVYKRVAVEVGYASDAASLLPSLRAAASGDDNRVSHAPRRGFLLKAGLAAAAIIILAFLGWQSARSNLFQPSPESSPVETAAIAGGEKTMTLSDGSQILLLGATALQVRYGGAERSIILAKGRARFTVAHDASRPFVVHVQGGTVTAVGTVFEVDAGGQVSVHLLSGRVKVSLPHHEAAADAGTLILTSGQQLAFDRAGQIKAPVKSLTPSGPADVQSFDDVPASRIVEQVNQTSPVKIVLLDADAAERKVFAELDVRDADAVARKLAAILGLEVDRTHPREIRLQESH